jgi:hypothetical protein
MVWLRNEPYHQHPSAAREKMKVGMATQITASATMGIPVVAGRAPVDAGLVLLAVVLLVALTAVGVECAVVAAEVLVSIFSAVLIDVLVC